jgi:hypothetical protein
MRLRSVLLGCLLAVGLLLVGVGSGLVDIPLGRDSTLVAPGDQATPVACPASLIEGTLVAGADGAMLLRVDGEPELVTVVWPDGWIVRGKGTAATLVAGTGAVVATAGDRVRIGGGFVSDAPGARRWLGCGGVTILVT